MPGIEVFDTRYHPISIAIVFFGSGFVDAEIEQAMRIIRLQSSWRLAHDVQVKIMHTRLV